MTITLAIALGLVLLLSGAYLLWQWWTGALREDRDRQTELDDDHECYDQGYDQGASDGDDTGYGRGRADEKADGTEPLRDVLTEITDLFISGDRRWSMDEGDWKAIAEEMCDKATAAL